MNIRYVTGCTKCRAIIFDGTPGEIYEAEKHEEACKNFEYVDLFKCSNCGNLSADTSDIENCDCGIQSF